MTRGVKRHGGEVLDQHVGAGIEHRRDVLAEVTGTDRGADGRDGLPAEGLGRGLDGLFLGPAPGVVGGDIEVAFARQAFAQLLAEGAGAHPGAVALAEHIAVAVLAGGVVGVGEGAEIQQAVLLGALASGDGHRAGEMMRRPKRPPAPVREIDAAAADRMHCGGFQRLGLGAGEDAGADVTW